MKSHMLIGISIIIFMGENLTLAVEKKDGTTGENLTSTVDQPEITTGKTSPTADNPDESADKSNLPALTCVVLGDPACDRMCKMVGQIYATPVHQAECDPNNNCKCSIIEHQFLDDLWKEKFTSMELLKEIKTNRKQYKDILTVMRTPFKTREQTKNDLVWFLAPEYLSKIQVTDNVAENMIKNNGKGGFDHDNVRSYVTRNLQSEPLQLPADFCFRTRFNEVLKNTQDKDTVQNIIHDVRRTGNPILNELADNFLKENNIQEDKDDFEEDEDGEPLTDILDLMIVSEFIMPSPIKTDNTTTSNQDNHETNETSKDWDWDLPELDVASVEKFNVDGGYKCWNHENPDYRVCQFKAAWGENQVWWKKGSDKVHISAQDTGEIDQEWEFYTGVKISLRRASNGDLEQTWYFAPDSQLLHVKSGNAVNDIWTNDKEDLENLAKYRSLIDLWCDKNGIFIKRDLCVIY